MFLTNQSSVLSYCFDMDLFNLLRSFFKFPSFAKFYDNIGKGCFLYDTYS